jgi:hypothetical protein
MKNEGYGSMLREHMKRVLCKPAGDFRPLNRRIGALEANLDWLSMLVFVLFVGIAIVEVIYHGIH